MEKIIVELGANKGTDTLRLIQENPDAIVYAFEPTHELLVNYLWPLSLEYKQLYVLPFAVDVENSFKHFKIAGQADWGCSSLYDFTDDIHFKWHNRPDFKKTHEYVVPTITMHDFCNLYNISKIDYLHIDTQGNDFNCLLSFKNHIDKVQSGRCEVAAQTELYKGTNNTYNNVKPWLTEKGFTVIDGDDFNLKHEIDLLFSK